MLAGSLTDFFSSSPAETFALGQKIAEHLTPGSVIAISGTLGSGKTHLVKGITNGLGLTENITSPTYTIINEYPFLSTDGSKNILYHIDVYRLKNAMEFEDIGGLEILNSNGICLIEWSEKIENLLPPGKISILIEITGSSSRNIKINGLKN